MSIQPFLPAPTDWSFVTSSGAEISVGLAEVVNIGGTIGELHLREGDGLVIQLQYVAQKIGLGAGLSLLGPLSGGFSLASFQAGGIGRIYKGPAAGARLSINDMIGPFCMLTFGLNAAPAGFAVSVVFMGLPVGYMVSSVLSELTQGMSKWPMRLFAKGAGVFWGMSGSSSGGIEANETTGTILAAYCGGLEVAGD